MVNTTKTVFGGSTSSSDRGLVSRVLKRWACSSAAWRQEFRGPSIRGKTSYRDDAQVGLRRSSDMVHIHMLFGCRLRSVAKKGVGFQPKRPSRITAEVK